MMTGKFTGRHMLIVTLSFFGVIIVVNLTMAYLAGATWSGLVVKNGYVASQSFNTDQARARALGWKAVMRREATSITAIFTDDKAAPLGGLAVTGELRRPATERDDQPLIFTEQQRGTYTAPATLAPGVWDIEIAAASFHQSFRVVAPQ